MTRISSSNNTSSIQTLRKVSFDTNTWSSPSTSSNSARCSRRSTCLNVSLESVTDDISAPKFLEQWNGIHACTQNSNSCPDYDSNTSVRATASKKRPLHTHTSNATSTISPSARKLSRLSRSGCLKSLVHDHATDSTSTCTFHESENESPTNSHIPSVSDDDLLSGACGDFAATLTPTRPLSSTSSSTLSTELDLSFTPLVPLAFSNHRSPESTSSSSSSTCPSSDISMHTNDETSSSTTGWGHFVDVIPASIDRFRSTSSAARREHRDKQNVPRRSKMTIKRLASFRRRYKSSSSVQVHLSPFQSTTSSSTTSPITTKKNKSKSNRTTHKLRCVDTISSALHRMSF